MGVRLEPVNAPQIKKMDTTDIIEAGLFAVTALSSPNVTVFKLVKSRDLVMNLDTWLYPNIATRKIVTYIIRMVILCSPDGQ